MNGVSGKVVLITGASSGIGEACARMLGKMGAIVILTSRNEQKLRKIAETMRNEGVRADYYSLDVTVLPDFQEVINRVIQTYERIDVLINNAGIMQLSAIRELKVDEWYQMIDVNLKGVLHGTASVLPVMRNQKKGMIINMISTAAYRVMPNSSVYSATKFAIKAFSEGLRKEEANNGIRVCLLAPGPVKTELLNHTTSDAIRDSLAEYVQGYGLEPEDIANAIVYQIAIPDSVSIDELIISPSHKM